MRKKLPLVSVIVTVYNLEEYITKCIQSIQKQSFTDFEAIIIDDGSSDSSYYKITSLVKKDSRFRIIKKAQNEGVVKARYDGLETATAKYITFLDGDDYWHKDFLLKMHEGIEAQKVDVLLCNFSTFEGKDAKKSLFKNNLAKFQKHNDYLNTKNYISNFLWDKIYKKEFLDQIDFNVEVKSYEDVYLLLEIYNKARISSINDALYFYRRRLGSITNRVPANYLTDRLSIVARQFEVFNLNEDSNDDYFTFCYLKTFVAFYLITIARFSNDYEEDVERFFAVADKKRFNLKVIFRLFFKEPRISISLIIFLFSPRLFKTFITLFKKRNYV